MALGSPEARAWAAQQAAQETVYQRFVDGFARPQGREVLVPVQFRDGGTTVCIDRYEWARQPDEASQRALVAVRLESAQRRVDMAVQAQRVNAQ